MPSSTAQHELTDFVCTACGCMCDDLTLTIAGNRITAVEPPCPAAAHFFLRDRPALPAPAMIDGQPAELAAAIARAAEILRSAHAPLIMGLERAVCDAQRAAVALADRLGAAIDPTDDRGASRNYAAVQTVGAVTATLGEVAARSDLIIYWNVDPARTHPRHIERFVRHPHTAPGDPPQQRRIITVAPSRSQTSQLSDDFLQLKPGGDVAALSILRAIIASVALDERHLNERHVEAQTGASLAQWAYLAQRLKMARYAAIFYQSPAGNPGGPDALAQAVTELVRDHHRHTRAVALSLGSPGNAVGVAQVLTWQTGFPAAVNFNRGYPRYLPGEASAAVLLERGEADAALVIAADPFPHLAPAVQERWRALPTIVLDDHASESARHATVAIFTATFGIETAGSVYRSDGVSLPLGAAIPPTRPTIEQLLARLGEGKKNSTRIERIGADQMKTRENKLFG